MKTTAKSQHNIAIWARDLPRTRWAWSCGCGTRYQQDLPDRVAASREAHAHANAANRATA